MIEKRSPREFSFHRGVSLVSRIRLLWIYALDLEKVIIPSQLYLYCCFMILNDSVLDFAFFTGHRSLIFLISIYIPAANLDDTALIRERKPWIMSGRLYFFFLHSHIWLNFFFFIFHLVWKLNFKILFNLISILLSWSYDLFADLRGSLKYTHVILFYFIFIFLQYFIF
jgi:hypothetical protein